MRLDVRAEPQGRLSSLSPNRWPVRWRIAAVSATLTFAILVVFAFVVGQLAAEKLKSNFREDLQGQANGIANNLEVVLTFAGSKVTQRSGDPDDFVVPDDAKWRVVDPAGVPIENSPPAPDLGAPADEVERAGSYEVASTPLPALGGPEVYVQYARSRASLESTTDRLWLFLGGGVLGGTALALLAGLAVAGRAMRPIAGLTSAAQEIAMTRDPSLRLPTPQSDDEVAELARTLDNMLRQLDAARAETEQVIQAQREFVADASHELRTPLTSILANLELLQDRLAARGGDDEEAEIVEGALGSSRRMRRLVADLLLLARADAGRSGPRTDCDLAEIATAALAEVRPVADGHILSIDSPQPVQILGNPDDLHRLVANLLENAVRHTPAGTRVQITVERRNGAATLEVSDDGPGLPDGVGDQIFARFVRGGGPADTAREVGTGLGLAIVKAVATSHGGDVEAGRSPGGGARFTVRLPVHEHSLTLSPAGPQ